MTTGRLLAGFFLALLALCAAVDALVGGPVCDAGVEVGVDR